MILLSLNIQIGGRILLRQGKKNNIRLIDKYQLISVLGEDVCPALLCVHAWTGCDSVSAFAGQGKIKELHLIRVSNAFREAFEAIGTKMAYI